MTERSRFIFLSMRRRWRPAVIVVFALPLAGLALFWCAVSFWRYPSSLVVSPPPARWVIDRNGIPLAALTAPDEQWRMPLAREQITPHLLDAIVAIEDHRFYDHGGVDWRCVAAAAWQDLRSLRVRRGASTLTMQLHRLRDPRPRSMWAKVEQAVRAVQIERAMSKEQILVEYLNRASFGGNYIGAGAASWHYFNRPCADLTIAQAALLAGLPQRPDRFFPDYHAQQAKARRDIVLARMLACRMITRAEHDQAANEPVEASRRPLPQSDGDDRGEACGALATLIALPNRSRDAIVQTTLDAATQRQTYTAARAALSDLAPSGVGAAAVVVLDTSSAECRAAVSIVAQGRNDLDLTARPRSTGSVLKPFIYAAAFDQHACAPDTVLIDAPRGWSGFVPRNFDKNFGGAMTAAEALARSRNLPALQLLSKIGVNHAISVMSAAGITTPAKTPNRYGLSLAVGGAEASSMEIAEAYATLGRGGVHKPLVITKAVSPTTSPSAVCFTPDTCWQILAALADPDRTAAVDADAVDCGVAWKTGTSSDNRDAWCAAVTPTVTVVVWMGNVSGGGSHQLVGAESSAPLALRLAASLSPRGARWPRPVDPHPSLLARETRSSRLTLLSPADNITIAPDPDAAPASQKVLLRALPAAVAEQREPLFWFVDGRSVATARGDEPAWWMPTPGNHEIRVVDTRGRWARARVRIVRPGG